VTDALPELKDEPCLEKCDDNDPLPMEGFLAIFSLKEGLGFLMASTADCLTQTFVPLSTGTDIMLTLLCDDCVSCTL
jgi:hypothetical protein